MAAIELPSDQTIPSQPLEVEGAATAPDDIVVAIGERDDQLVIAASSRHGSVGPFHSSVPTVSSMSTGNAVETGTLLASAVLTPEIRELVLESVNLTEDTAPGLFIHAQNQSVRELPWETLYDPDRSRFTALNPALPLARVDFGAIPLARRTVEPGDLRVRVIGRSLNEASAFAESLQVESGIELSAGLPGSMPKRTPHVAILLEGADDLSAIPEGTLLACLRGDTERAYLATNDTESAIALPPSMDHERARHFLAVLLDRLRRGTPVPASVAYARIALHRLNTDSIDWLMPVLVCSSPPAPLIRPKYLLTEVGGRVKSETVSWAKDAAQGVLSSVVVFLVGLLLYRFGFSSQSEFELDVLSPYSLYQSFSNLIIDLSAMQEFFLLGAALVIGVLAATVGFLWWTTPADLEAANGSTKLRLQTTFGRVRSFAFLTVAALTVLAAYGYQQYLWRVSLPIPVDKVGIAITRETAAASFQSDLAGALHDQGLGEQVVVRELPVEFNASDTARARDMASRIHADAVIIYQAIGPEDDREYAAYLVFADPTIGVAIPGRTESQPISDMATTPLSSTVQLKDGVSLPTLRTRDLSQLVHAAAGIIAYEDDRRRDAIASLERARESDPDSPSAAIINFYLGNAYALDHQTSAASIAFQAAAAAIEERGRNSPLGPEEDLLLVKSYTEIGRLAANNDDWTSAINWYDRALSRRNELLARSQSLENPSEIRSAYARLYSLLATAYRATNNPEEERFWVQRTSDELTEFRSQIDDTDVGQLVTLSGITLLAGDCVGSADAIRKALAIEPDNVDARINAAAVAYFQGLDDESRAYLESVTLLAPDDIRIIEQLGLSYLAQAIRPESLLFEPAYLDDSARYFATAVAIDPHSVFAYDSLAEVSSWNGSSALLDLSGLFAEDDVVTAGRQVLWAQDPARQATAIASYSRAIHDKRIVAGELKPNNPSAAVQLAGAYAERMRVRANALIYQRDEIGTRELTRFGEQMLDDAGQVILITRDVLEHPDAAYGDQLQATALLLEALNWSWNWHYLYASDQVSSSETGASLREAISAATELLDRGVPQSTADADAMRAIYFEQYRYASLVLLDSEQAAAAAAARDSVQNPPTPDASLLRSLCFEERSSLAGDAAFQTGDLERAREHYEAALDVNRAHEPAIEGLVAISLMNGDLEEAFDHARRATEVAPSVPTAWSALAAAATLVDDEETRDEAFDEFVARIAELPQNERVNQLRATIDLFDSLAQLRPVDSGKLGAAAPLLFDVMTQSDIDSDVPALPTALAKLGHFALITGDPEAAERSLARSVELYPYNPVASLNLALARIALDQNPSEVIESTIAVLSDPIWSTATVSQAELFTRLREEVSLIASTLSIDDPALEPINAALDQAEIDLGLAAAPESASTPTAGETYTSPTFEVEIDVTEPWNVASTSTESGADTAILSTDVSQLLLSFSGSGGQTAQECLDGLMQFFTESETFMNQQIVPIDGDPAADRDDRAATRLTYFDTGFQAVPGDETANNATAHIGCWTLPDGITVLAIIHIAPSDQLEQENGYREELLATLRVRE
jgi:tetratricopeptide (TPR) repeat protein